jgi:WD40 repeat protein
LFVWDLKQGSFESLDQSDPTAIFSIAYSSDGKQLLSGHDSGQIILWDLQTRTSIKIIAASESPVRTVAFLDTRWITAGDDGIIRIWNEGDLQHEWFGHKRAVLALAVSPNGDQVVSSDAEGVIRVWSVSTGQTGQVLKASDDAVNAVAITSNGRQAITGGADGVVRLWQLPFGG